MASSSKPQQVEAEWWRGAVIYQIYPRSYLDTNGDGVGDLPGCIKKLPYIAVLGVEAIWLSPFFRSPMEDFGYDVADYCDVDPLFGTLDDFDQLIEEAHKLNIKIIIDQVYSHTSDQHDWFLESRQDQDNPKANWYVWADPQPDGSPPSNWQSVFGGPAWAWDNRRRQYYLHNFLTSQPDLNLHNSQVQNALLDVARFWLDRGVDGFRLDALNFAMHDPELKDNPPKQNFDQTPTRPFDYQEQIHNMSHPDILKFLERIRKTTDSYDGDRFTVAEIARPDPQKDMNEYTANNIRLNTAYSFDYLYTSEISPAFIRKASNHWLTDQDQGWPSWAFSNHDAPRVASRWSNDQPNPRLTRLYAMLLMSLRGNIFLYQGEELGLPQAEVPFEKLQDPEAIANWPETLGRDGARTPMPWSEERPHAGFSPEDPWLPVDDRHVSLAAEIQAQDPQSTLAFFRELICFRRQEPALLLGDLTFLDTPDDTLAFIRSDDTNEILCAFNFSSDPSKWLPPDATNWKVELTTASPAPPSPPIVLDGWSGFYARKVN